jgi:hypothetical protein
LTHVGVLGWTHVGARKDLRIAARHRGHFCGEFDGFASSRLRGALAGFADRDGHLIARASFVNWPAQHVPRHQ